jgi:hypothetical protein
LSYNQTLHFILPEFIMPTLMRNCLVIWLTLASPATSAEPQWIWSHAKASTQAEPGAVAFRKTFQATRVGDAKLEIAADNRFELFVNGRRVGAGEGWNQRRQFTITSLLLPGRNVIAVSGVNDGADPAGLMVQLHLKPTIGAAETIVSDATWKANAQPAVGWQGSEFDDSKWNDAAALGDYGKTAPWGAAGGIVEHDASTTTKPRNTERGLFEFKDGDRLVLLGSTFIERMQSNGYFELELQCAHPDKKIAVRNLGWSGDNVWGDSRAVFGQRADGFKRLVNDVNLCKPSVILVCYGENEAYAGEAGLIEFRSGFETLLEALEATGARLVIATPRKHENVGPPFPDPTEYNQSLRKYCDVMKAIAKEREHTFVDWYDIETLSIYTADSMRDNANSYSTAHARMAKTLGCVRNQWKLDFNFADQTYNAESVQILSLNASADSFQLTTLDRTLQGSPQFNETHDFHSLKFRGEAGYSCAYYCFRNLLPGKYVFTVNGKKKRTDTHDGFATGVFTSHPNYDQITELMKTIRQKDFLFFNRYRPQNETYLFLFRKHEQGNNAVEIPQFDPLIDELDQKIATLKKPQLQKYELKKVE